MLRGHLYPSLVQQRPSSKGRSHRGDIPHAPLGAFDRAREGGAIGFTAIGDHELHNLPFIQSGWQRTLAIYDYFSRKQVHTNSIEQVKMLNKVEDDGFVWIFVGRLVKEKGLIELWNAFKKILEHHPNDQLWMLGEVEQDRDPIPEEMLNE
jgi:glycosyltransferase involved in cell wall biosynthesis